MEISQSRLNEKYLFEAKLCNWEIVNVRVIHLGSHIITEEKEPREIAIDELEYIYFIS